MQPENDDAGAINEEEYDFFDLRRGLSVGGGGGIGSGLNVMTGMVRRSRLWYRRLPPMSTSTG